MENSKKALFETWFEQDHIMVHLDSRADGVVVPAHLAGNPALTLKLSRNFQGATTIGEKDISAFLKFSGNYFECILPWDAIWGLASEQGDERLWVDSLPREILEEFAVRHLQSLAMQGTAQISNQLSSEKVGDGEEQASDLRSSTDSGSSTGRTIPEMHVVAEHHPSKDLSEKTENPAIISLEDRKKTRPTLTRIK